MLRKEKINKCIHLYLTCDCINIIRYIRINSCILHYYTNTIIFTFILTNVSLRNERTNDKTNAHTNVYTFVK